MNRKYKIRKYVSIVFLSMVALLFMTGCTSSEIRDLTHDVDTVHSQVADVAEAIGKADYDGDELLNLLKALQAGNAASAPFNPYVLPIGAGLGGVVAMLEALRRKEKGQRKYAEHELRNGNNGKPPGKK